MKPQPEVSVSDLKHRSRAEVADDMQVPQWDGKSPAGYPANIANTNMVIWSKPLSSTHIKCFFRFSSALSQPLFLVQIQKSQDIHISLL